MHWQIIVALVVMIPVILLPVAYVWFLNFGGLSAVMKRARGRSAEAKKAETEIPMD